MEYEVEIIKLGEILRVKASNDIAQNVSSRLPTIMICEETTDIIKYYLDILKDTVKDRYDILKTKGIIRQPTLSYFAIPGSTSVPITGVLHEGHPIIGHAFFLKNSVWHSSEVLEVIGEDVIITRNSVYLLYSKSKSRDKKLKDLGIR
jgi:hypothetical protein